MTKPFKEESRIDYSGTNKGNATVEQINCGSLQRIADATELMAKNYAKMERDLRWYKENYPRRNAQIEKLERSNSALRGVITRMKNKAGK